MTTVSQLIAEQANANMNKSTWGTIIYNVKAYGAKGDGVTDDTTSVQAAITAAKTKGGVVFFPPGSYNLVNMTGVNGQVRLLSFGDAVVTGFKYEDLSMPSQAFASSPTADDALFTADGIIFQGQGDRPALWIVNQSQTGVIRSFSIRNCEFRGKIGLKTENCLTSTLRNCDFIHNQIGWYALSCTNIIATDCQFFSPVFGVYIDKSSVDTVVRRGGENLKFQGCTWIDGVTGIYAINHNYLWLNNCLIDYFNCGLHMTGCRYGRMTQCYIGYHDNNKSSLPNYVAPIKYAAVYGEGDQATGRPVGMQHVNSQFAIYDASDFTPVRYDGSVTAFTGVEECDFDTCYFLSENLNNSNPYLLEVKSAQDVYQRGSRYYSKNDFLLKPWNFVSVNRLYDERNIFFNCFKADGTTHVDQPNYTGNRKFESGTITVLTNGTPTTDGGSYTYKNQYTSIPNVVATVKTGLPAEVSEKLNVSLDAQDINSVFVKVRQTDAVNLTSGNNIVVNIQIMGD